MFRDVDNDKDDLFPVERKLIMSLVYLDLGMALIIILILLFT